MLNAQDILNFNFSSDSIKQSAQKIIPITLSSLIEHRTDKLQKITKELGESSFKFSGHNLVPQVFRKFKESIDYQHDNFVRKEIRALSFALNYSEMNMPSIMQNEYEVALALGLMNKKWSASFLIGLMDCLLRNWDLKHLKSFEKLELFISEKLDSYSEKRSIIIALKKNKRFFNTKNGDLLLGDTIAKLNKPIREVTHILGLSESWIGYNYFSKVIITYYERVKTNIVNELDGLSEILERHNNSVTSKRLISKIIIQTNQAEFLPLQEKVKNIALKQIGDPANTSNWIAFENATELEKLEIFSAREILNEWITQQFINVFFNVCINDERRKRFWLRFASKISSFKVYGPMRTKNTLQLDERISGLVDSRFETVSSSRDISAFILYIGDYMLIEFSNAGYACCSYKANSRNRPALDYQLTSVDDLRNTSLPLAIQSDAGSFYLSDEGRLFHNENWEIKFNLWMTQKIFK